jgi:hypothetical protein
MAAFHRHDQLLDAAQRGFAIARCLDASSPAGRRDRALLRPDGLLLGRIAALGMSIPGRVP